MTRNQCYKYETFVRVRDFGTVNTNLFPESSAGRERFDLVSAVVGTIEQHLKDTVIGQAEGRKVKPLTRAAVYESLKTMAGVARRVMREERALNPFLMPPRRGIKIELATARAFLEEAAKRQEAFVRFGMAPTFIADLTTLVNDLQSALDTQLNSKTVRGQARAGLAVAIREGFNAVLDLDVIVAIATEKHPTLAAAWRTARRVEGQNDPTADAPKPAEATAPTADTAPTSSAKPAA